MNAIQEAAARMKKAIGEPCSISIGSTHWFRSGGSEEINWATSVHLKGGCKLHHAPLLSELVTVVCAFYRTPDGDDLAMQQYEETAILETIK